MGEITVYFVGICTFMQDFEKHLPGVRRRVVLVNASEPQVINQTVIPPHISTLRIAARDLEVNGVAATSNDGCVLQWELQGCKLEIVDPVGELEHDESFECCVPHLKKLTPEAEGVSVPVVLGAQPEMTSCYFDLTAGVLSAGTISAGAVISVLKVQTKADSPMLRVKPFRTNEAQEFQLRSGAQIAIMNTGQADLDGDDANDFLLHYNVVEEIPSNAAVPTTNAACCKPLDPSTAYILPTIGLGPGCSNANFP